VGLRDLAAEDQADAGAAGLRGEERHEQVGRIGQPGPFVVHPQLQRVAAPGRSTHHARARRGERPADPDAAARFARRVDGVAHEVDQELLELIAVGVHGHQRSWLDRNPLVSLEPHDARDKGGDVERRELGRRQPGEAGVRRHEPAQRLRSRGDDGEPTQRVVAPVAGRRLALDE
jgi:hypothetical protein